MASYLIRDVASVTVQYLEEAELWTQARPVLHREADPSPVALAAHAELIRREMYLETYTPGVQYLERTLIRHFQAVSPVRTVNYPFLRVAHSGGVGAEVRRLEIVPAFAREFEFPIADHLPDRDMENLEELSLHPALLLCAVRHYEQQTLIHSVLTSYPLRLPALPFLTMHNLRRLDLLHSSGNYEQSIVYSGLAEQVAQLTCLVSLSIPYCATCEPLRVLTTLEELTFQPLGEQQLVWLHSLSSLRRLRIVLDSVTTAMSGGGIAYKIDKYDLRALPLLQHLDCDYSWDGRAKTIRLHPLCQLLTFRGPAKRKLLLQQTALTDLNERAGAGNELTPAVLDGLSALRSLTICDEIGWGGTGLRGLTRLVLHGELSSTIAVPLHVLTALRELELLNALDDAITRLPASLECLVTTMHHSNWEDLTRLRELTMWIWEGDDYQGLVALTALTRLDTLDYDTDDHPPLPVVIPSLRVLHTTYAPVVLEHHALVELEVDEPSFEVLPQLAALPRLRRLGVLYAWNAIKDQDARNQEYERWRTRLLELAAHHALEIYM